MRNSKRGIRNRKRRSRSLNYQTLEDRRLLAFSFGFDSATDTLTLTQTSDDGDVEIDNNGDFSAFRVSEGFDTTEFLPADNLIVNLLDSTGVGDLQLKLENPHTGDVELNLQSGDRIVEIKGNSNEIGGNLEIFGKDDDQKIKLDGTTVGGDINVSLGEGNNEADLDGEFGGSNVTYRVGSGNDRVNYQMAGLPANINFVLDGGQDSVTLGANVNLSRLRIDFGGGEDTFENQLGAFDFDASLENWAGYTRDYFHAESLWSITQLFDTGEVVLDNKGDNEAFRLEIPGVFEPTSMAPADNVRMNMVQNSGTSIEVDLENDVVGYVQLNLGAGDREVKFTGESNTIGTDLRVYGNAGDQNVELSPMSDFAVGRNVNINLAGGMDSISNTDHDITIPRAFYTLGVNAFSNDGTLTVNGNLDFDVRNEAIDTVFQNLDTVIVDGQFSYYGGGGTDIVNLDHGFNIGGFGYVDLAGGSGEAPQIASMTDGFVAANRMTIVAAENDLGTIMLTDPATDIMGDFVVNFSASNTYLNLAVFLGTFGGTYGRYDGGSSLDVVNLSATAPDMDFRAFLYGGDDVFRLGGDTDLNSLRVDFGSGTDTFEDDLGMPYPFPVTLLNLP